MSTNYYGHIKILYFVTFNHVNELNIYFMNVDHIFSIYYSFNFIVLFYNPFGNNIYIIRKKFMILFFDYVFQ